MERLVAIKVCSTEDEQIRKRFLREAKIAGGLDHPNIVIAFDFGTEQDLPYLVQELLTGEDLRAIIDRQEPLGPDIKLRYLVQIAKGLQHAHAQGVWHRDIKPANVRILDDGRAKLMDFGMAKITNESGTRLTADGSVMGTAGYFAPEQLKALELDQRVDIFSYGVLAYELLTYRKVFPGETFMVVFRQVLHDEPEAIRPSGRTAPKSWRKWSRNPWPRSPMIVSRASTTSSPSSTPSSVAPASIGALRTAELTSHKSLQLRF